MLNGTLLPYTITPEGSENPAARSQGAIPHLYTCTVVRPAHANDVRQRTGLLWCLPGHAAAIVNAWNRQAVYIPDGETLSMPLYVYTLEPRDETA